ncbi:dihydroorotase [Peribacillus psychrosaccharolyticus]|uniref:Dihydroorotase n=1 Tax=Peribacillus psychrosaccharolyticus TaxID=1407 RepID=A0A974NPG1_PERPY|nr:dihydroorotase [Peribacillus psychrosaccharolyticus]MEC2053719.1 dihydroorotase [Peribacillus psychrosaccharolyticus]MED3742666.1 dihydroorotase [Peribacillus psychrosaccharolyticus]QQT01610.1 dihydroorotase [Peribacillus psychrosaccharolyticus]
MKTIIKNGVLLDSTGALTQADVEMEGKYITKVAENIAAEGLQQIDAKGNLIAPGFIDLHVHLREPGGEKKETIATGTMAAAKGGFTTIAAMPNTRPVPDSVDHLESLLQKIEADAHVRVLPYASITVREAGKELTEFASLKEAGAFAFTDDGVGIQNAGMMLEAMKKAALIDMPVVAHCEENSLIYNGCVHEGTYSKANGLKGIPSVCESVHIARDILLAEAAGCHYHVCHISTKESVRLVRDAKRAGIRVTAEVTPHHLLLCEDDIPGLDTNYKMNPPLRGKSDREALLEGLLDGTIDFIATDHAPHLEEEKAEGMNLAPFGIVGLETAFPLLYSGFVQTDKWTLKQLIDWLTVRPAESFSLPYGSLSEGALADIVLIDLNQTQSINSKEFASKGKNTPFAGQICTGWPVMTIVEGQIVWEKGSAAE